MFLICPMEDTLEFHLKTFLQNQLIFKPPEYCGTTYFDPLPESIEQALVKNKDGPFSVTTYDKEIGVEYTIRIEFTEGRYILVFEMHKLQDE